LKRLHRKLGTTIVHVTHDQVEALTLADRIVVLNGGVVQQVGTPRELFDRPDNTFVATFIGSPSMNLLRKRLGAGVGMSLDWDEGTVLGVRPTDIEIGVGDLPARVDVVESLGAEAIVHLDLESGERLLARVSEPISVAADDTTRVRFACVHRFDSETGRRLA